MASWGKTFPPRVNSHCTSHVRRKAQWRWINCWSCDTRSWFWRVGGSFESNLQVLEHGQPILSRWWSWKSQLWLSKNQAQLCQLPWPFSDREMVSCSDDLSRTPVAISAMSIWWGALFRSWGLKVSRSTLDGQFTVILQSFARNSLSSWW